MNKKNKINFVVKSGFTLIELSIVLIIIGLLIAGVSAGGSLIKGAEIRSIMSDARTYSVAIKTYFVQYDSLPGDGTKDLKSSGYVGDNDGKIEYQSKTCGNKFRKIFGPKISCILWSGLSAKILFFS